MKGQYPTQEIENLPQSVILAETHVLQVPGEDDPLKKLKKVSDTVTATKAIVVPKPVPTPKFGQKVTKKKSNIGQ